MQENEKYAAWYSKIEKDINNSVEYYTTTSRADSLELWEVTNKLVSKWGITEKQKEALRETMKLYRVMLDGSLDMLEQYNNLRHTESMLGFSWMPLDAKREFFLRRAKKKFNVIQGGQQ